jgi:hypothetical protein
MKLTLLKGWHLMRWLRLGLGTYIILHAIQLHEIFAGILGMFLLYQAITNVGCCGINNCTILAKKTKKNQDEHITFEEVN